MPTREDVVTWIKKQGADTAGMFGDITNLVGTPFVNAARNFSAVLQNKPIPDQKKKIVPGDSEFYRDLVGVPQEDSLTEIAASLLSPFVLGALGKGAKVVKAGSSSRATALRQIQDEAGSKPPVYSFSPSDPARKGYETLVANSAGKLDDVQFFEQMADHLVEAGKISEKEAKRLKSLNVRFGSEGSWQYIQDVRQGNAQAILDLKADAPQELKKLHGNYAVFDIAKGSEEAADIRLLQQEDRRASRRLQKDLEEQSDIINNIKNNIADLVEPVVRENAKKMGYSADRYERAKELGFNTDTIFARVDSAFSEHSNPMYVDPTRVAASGARTIPNEQIKGSNSRYDGQFFTDVRGPDPSAELGKYAGLGIGKNTTQFSPVHIKEDALINSYNAANPDHYNEVAEELLGGLITTPDDPMRLAQDLYRQSVHGTQRWDTLEKPAYMAAMKNKGFRGFYTDEAGALNSNISVFSGADVRDTRAVFDPALSWSPNRFAAVGAAPVTDPLLEYLNSSFQE